MPARVLLLGNMLRLMHFRGDCGRSSHNIKVIYNPGRQESGKEREKVECHSRAALSLCWEEGGMIVRNP